VNPELFLQLDRVIHEKGRLAIMSALAAAPELSFTELRDLLDMTDGTSPRTSARCSRKDSFPWRNPTRTTARSPPVRSRRRAARRSPNTSACWSRSSGNPKKI